MPTDIEKIEMMRDVGQVDSVGNGAATKEVEHVALRRQLKSRHIAMIR